MIEKIIKLFRRSIFIQGLLLAVLIFVGFYKTLQFSFHAGREIGFLLQITGGDFSLMNLIRSHGFISLFNYKVFGANPTGWYLSGIVLHILASLAVLIVISNLTKNKLIGFLIAIWFSVSVSWHDVITFGSGESVYAAQLLLFLLSLFFYKRFRERIQTKISYTFSFIFILLTLPLRELGIIFFPVLFLFDIIYFWNYNKKKSIKENAISLIIFLKPQYLFIATSFAYLFFQQNYAVSPHYFADERVRLKYNLLSQGKFLEYIYYSILSFGAYLPPHFLPYPIINFIRKFFTIFFNQEEFKILYFPTFGYILYFLTAWLLYKKRQHKYFRHLLFGFVLFSVPTFFYSTAVTIDRQYLLNDYYYDENRWRYFAFLGTSIIFILYGDIFLSSIVSKKKSQIITIFLIGCNLFMNIGFLWHEEDLMYQDMFKEQKVFYKTMFELFPTYSSNNALYYPINSYRLGDYMTEWYMFRDLYYPTISSKWRKDFEYHELSKVLKAIEDKRLNLKDIHFISFDPEIGNINYTEKVKNALLNQKPIVLMQNEYVTQKHIAIDRKKSPPIEIPYQVEVTLHATLSGNSNSKHQMINDKFNALKLYMQSHNTLLDTMHVDVCLTHGNYDVFGKDHLLDNMYGERSIWWSDCLPAWFTLDLGKEYDISGFIMGDIKEDSLAPSAYYYEVSSDGNKWDKVMQVKRNTRWEIMDKWPKSYKARYIRVTVDATQKGGFVQLDEVEPVLSFANEIFTYYTSRDTLLEDAHMLFATANTEQLAELVASNINTAYGSFSWKTNFLNTPVTNTRYFFPFSFDGDNHIYTFPIFESELFSQNGQFFKRKFTDFYLDFSNFPGTVYVENLQLVPQYGLDALKKK